MVLLLMLNVSYRDACGSASCHRACDAYETYACGRRLDLLDLLDLPDLPDLLDLLGRHHLLQNPALPAVLGRRDLQPHHPEEREKAVLHHHGAYGGHCVSFF